jgi:N6-adenosine-specific RNA methylase IME4
MSADITFAGLRPAGGFGLIMADPPWLFSTRSPKGVTAKGAGGQYRCASQAWICDLPVRDLAAKDCVLWLWATNPMLPEAFEVMAAWGFQFKTAGHWAKTTRHGKQAFGTGYILRCAGEPFLIGTRGAPRTSRSVRSVIMGPVRQHSRKPEEAYAAAEALMPDVQRLELFSRASRAGWSVWGNEAGKFDGVAA